MNILPKAWTNKIIALIAHKSEGSSSIDASFKFMDIF